MMGGVLLAGGIVGSLFGVQLVGILRRLGLFDFFVSVCYVTFLGVIGTLMLIESAQHHAQGARRRRRSAAPLGPAQLDPRPAAEDALPALQALHQRHPAVR